ncbi:MAG: hypothetical protein Q8S73_14015 [Deltaproteobacteria bacterium]|nr:hypothetical protein [Myxococcales bacterium]MDP3215218.1 hypothetical protein [Deltaproteobacteria bacterium]
MATTRTKTTRTKSTPDTRALPAALAKRAKAQHDAKRQRLAAVGFAAIALVNDLRRRVTGDYLAIGKALAELRQNGVADALGCADFAEICQRHFAMSVEHAERLVRLAERFERAVALDLGYERACALLALADATPEDDAPEELLHATLTLPTKETLVVDGASTAQLFAAAKAFRQARADANPGGTDKGGRTTTVAERAAFRALQKHVAADERFEPVRLTHVARGKAQGAVIRVDVPQALWEAFVRAMAKRKQ